MVFLGKKIAEEFGISQQTVSDINIIQDILPYEREDPESNIVGNQ